MRKLLNRKIVEQNRKCAICHKEFTDYNDIAPYADIGKMYWTKPPRCRWRYGY
jgi:hypothetical protein